MKQKNSKILAVDKQVRPTDIAIINELEDTNNKADSALLGIAEVKERIDNIKIPIPKEVVIPEYKPTDIAPILNKLDSLTEEVKKKEEVTDIQVSDEVLAKIKGEPGKDYVLTEEDKKSIAKKIKVPVIEKTEVVREIPIVREVAISDTPTQLAEKINTLDKQIDWKVLKNVPDLAGKKGTKLISARSGGAERYSELKDVNMDGLADGNMPIWDDTTKKWIPGTPTDTDEKVKLNASDPTAGYLDDKITAYKYELNFIVSDWVLNGANYELTVTHNLTSSNPKVSVLMAGSQVSPNSVSVIDSNNVLLSVPATPDLRFAGSVSVSAV